MAAEAPAKTRQDVTAREWHLIQELRRYPYSEVTVEMHEGQPHRILKGVEFVKL